MRRAAILTLVLAIGCGVAWLHAPTVDFDFVMFDDDINLYQNPHLGDLTAERIRWAFTDRTYMHRFMPLGWLAWCALMSAGGLDPAVYHTANVALHALNAVLVFTLVFQLLRTLAFRGEAGRRGETGRDPLATGLIAGILALVWAMHPLRVEVVAWSSGLLYLQATAWALLSGCLFLAGLTSPGRGSPLLHGLAIGVYALSVATYPVALGWPLAGFGVTLALRGTSEAQVSRWAWITPAATLALAFFGAIAAVGARVAVTSYWSAPDGLDAYPLVERVTRASFALLYFLWCQISAGTLSPVTEFFQIGNPARAWLWPSAVLVAGGAGFLVWRRNRWRGVALWVFAFVGVAGPFLGVLDRNFEPADRYTYLPGVVMVAGIAVLIHSAFRPRSGDPESPDGGGGRSRGEVRRRWIVGALMTTLAAAVPWLAAATREQLPVWRDSTTLYTHITEHLQHGTARAVYLARHAVHDMRRGDEAASRARLEQARAWARNRADLRPYEALIGRLRDRARAASDRPVAPAAVEALSLGLAAAKQGNRAGAEAQFERALLLDPAYFEARYNFVVFLAGTGRTLEAREQRELLDPRSAAFTPELRARLNQLLK